MPNLPSMSSGVATTLKYSLFYDVYIKSVSYYWRDVRNGFLIRIRNAYNLKGTKINKSKESGSGTEDIYKPKLPWFSIADRILHEVVQIRESQCTEILVTEKSTQEESQSTYVGETEIMN